MTSATTDVRYSTGNGTIGEAKNFNWEHPVPVDRFWDDLDFKTARSFFLAFTPDEVDKLPIDPERDGSMEKREKLELLHQLLRKKLAAEDSRHEPITYYDADYEAWRKVWLGIAGVQFALDDPELEQTMRMMISRRKNSEDLSQVHGLAVTLLENGKYADVEELEPEAVKWLDAKLGENSPQAISARQVLAEAIWNQGPHRAEEASKLFSEILSNVEGMKGTKYEVYQEEYGQIVRQTLQNLQTPQR